MVFLSLNSQSLSSLLMYMCISIIDENQYNSFRECSKKLTHSPRFSILLRYKTHTLVVCIDKIGAAT